MPTYREMLLDPRWQKKRLEVLEDAGWECEVCCDSERTLHVHHMRYVKGRKPWEYPRSELKELCAECHKEHHATRELLDDLMVAANPVQFEEIVAMVGGFLHGFMDTTEDQDSACLNLDPLAWQTGIFAAVIVGGAAFQADVARLMQNYFPERCFNPNQKAASDRALAAEGRED